MDAFANFRQHYPRLTTFFVEYLIGAFNIAAFCFVQGSDRLGLEIPYGSGTFLWRMHEYPILMACITLVWVFSLSILAYSRQHRVLKVRWLIRFYFCLGFVIMFVLAPGVGIFFVVAAVMLRARYKDQGVSGV